MLRWKLRERFKNNFVFAFFYTLYGDQQMLKNIWFELSRQSEKKFYDTVKFLCFFIQLNKCKRRLSNMLVRIDLKPNKILKSLSFLQASWHIFGIHFAPILLPIEERICTLAVYLWTHTILFLAPLSTLFLGYMFLMTEFWWLSLAYSGWIWIDRETMNVGGRSEWIRNWIRNLAFWKYFVRYFPIRLVKTGDLDPSRNYMNM